MAQIHSMKIIKPASQNGGWPKWQLAAKCSKCGNMHSDTVSGFREGIEQMMQQNRWLCCDCSTELEK